MKETTYELVEEMLVDCLKQMKGRDVGSKERASLKAEAIELAGVLHDIDHDNLEYWDKEDRRAVEREKTEANVEMEKEKGKMDPVRVALEICKIVIPVVVPLFAYDVFQKRLMTYEETGRVTSTAGRELHLPRIFK